MKISTYTEEDAVGIEMVLVGHSVAVVNEDTLLLDDGTELVLFGNMGCAGCPSGEYNLTELNGVDNIITKVELVNSPTDGDDGLYQIFVYADNVKVNLATFAGSDGNGWYGTGYKINVKRKGA